MMTKTAYYMQMAQNIRRYKGVRPIPQSSGYQKIRIDGTFKEWDKVKVEYRDTKGDVTHRDHKGYGGNHYVNNSGRNDIVLSKVAVDKDNVFFYVETMDKLSPFSDPNWMLLLIDVDNNASTGWYGYDFIVNKKVIDAQSTELMRYDEQAGEWKKVNTLSYRVNGNQLELSIPRADLGLIDDSFVFDFKWTDNPANLKDPISLCVDGDAAPNRRFNYRYIWNK